ncbi:MAG: VTC domain-containing protein [Acidimicrobiales bacterium]
MGNRRSSLYSSVYFDTADGQCHLAHVQGRRRRWKARTRKYLDSDLTRLELKVKSTRGRTVKLVRDIDSGQHGQLDNAGWDFLAQSLKSHYGLCLDSELMPTLEVTYRRVTLVDTAAGQRVTLDSDLRFVGLDGAVVGAMRGDAVLIETKSGALPSLADKLLWSHGIREAHCSKYCMARMLEGSPYQVPGLRRTLRRWFERISVGSDGGVVRPVAVALTA